MRGTLKRSAVLIVGLLVVAWAVLPMAVAAAASKDDVGNGDEAWFLKNKEPLASGPAGDPTCELPTGCNASGNAQRPGGPHPEGTLVVAANAGDDDAQMFFNFAVDKLPLGAVVTGGTVTMPVATDSDARAFRPEAAKLVACIVTGFIPGGAEGGSYQDRPEFDDSTCVPVEQDDTAETLTYTFNLDRFGKAWGSGATPMQGVTILKDPEVKPPDPRETWRVVFNSARRASEDPEKFPPITSDLEFKVQAGGLGGLGGGALPGAGGGGFDDAGFDSGGAPTGGSFDSGTTTGGSFDSGTTTGGSFDSGAAPSTGSISPPQSAGAPAVTEPETAAEPAQQPLAAPPTVVPAAATGMSPAVWILPLLAVAMAGALAWSLLQPVELVGEREGAVSKLMRNRRLAGSDPTSPV